MFLSKILHYIVLFLLFLQVSFNTTASSLNDPEIDPNNEKLSTPKPLSLEGKDDFPNVKEETQAFVFYGVETLPSEVWHLILSFIDTAPTLLALKKVNTRFVEIVNGYRKQSLNLTDPKSKSTYWYGTPEERWLIKASSNFLKKDYAFSTLEETEEVIHYFKRLTTAAERQQIKEDITLNSKERLTQDIIYNNVLLFINTQLEENNPTDLFEGLDENPSFLNNHPDLQPDKSYQEAASLSLMLQYQALRLNYYYSRLSELLGFMKDAKLKAIDVKEVIDEAQNNPHVLYFDYKHTLSPNIKKEELLKKAAGNPNENSFNIISLKALYHLGKFCESENQEIETEEEEREENVDKALDWYQKVIQHAENFSSIQGRRGVFENTVARRMYAKAHHRLGMLDFTGRTLKGVDFENALEHFLEASFYGHAKAQAFLGLLHFLEVPEVTVRRLTYYHTQVSNHIFHPHLENLNQEWLKEENSKGRSHPEEWQRKWAFYWSQRAALQGSKDGFFQLGILCEQSYNTPKLQQAATFYYKAAASRGSNSAKVKLPDLYPHAEFTTQDKEIIKFWRNLQDLPVNKNSRHAPTYIRELFLGYFYEVGYHVECSEKKAYMHYLSVNGIPGGTGIARLLRNPKCSLKDIKQDSEKRQNFGGEEGFFRILKALKYNTSVHNIDFPTIHYITKFIMLFEDTFTHNNSITSLKNIPHIMEPEMGFCLCKILKVNKALTKILLRGIDLKLEGAIAIAEGLKHNKSLTELDLASNRIGLQGTIAIAESLKHNNSLKKLDLGSNSIGLQGTIAIAEALKHNNSLTELDLRFNKIDSEGAIAIAESIVGNSSLTKVILFSNNIGIPGGARLRDSFARNNSLRELDFRNNHKSLKGNDYYSRTESDVREVDARNLTEECSNNCVIG